MVRQGDHVFSPSSISHLKWSLILGVSVYLLYPAPEDLLTPVIQTSDGPVQGRVAVSRNGSKVWQFLGIPYALPPTGHLKYLPPEPPIPWKEVKQVTEYAPRCAQYKALLNLRTDGELSCLFLNVFVHRGNNEMETNTSVPLKPVIVYIFGGGFMSGAISQFQPTYFMDHDIVLVNLNYRLGPFGFLNLGVEGGPRGNMALLDQLAVLRWVQKNIMEFGGDPERVTLMGNSAGAVASHLFLTSPLSRNLFSRAIIQSGSFLAPWAFTNNPVHVATEYAKRVLGKEHLELDELRRFFEETEWTDLVIHQKALVDPLIYTDLFNPSVDGNFIHDKPLNLLRSGNFSKVPVMFGMNSADGVIETAKFIGRKHLIKELDNGWNTLIRNVIMMDMPLKEENAAAIRTEYFGNSKNWADDPETFMANLVKLGCDSAFWFPIEWAAQLHQHHGGDTYLFMYNYTSKIYPGSVSLLRALTSDDFLINELGLLWAGVSDWVWEFVFGIPTTHKYGAGHAEELLTIWDVGGVSSWFVGPDRDFSEKMVALMVEFVEGKEPTWKGTEWPKPRGDQLPCVVLDEREGQPEIVWDLLGDHRPFWERVVREKWLE